MKCRCTRCKGVMDDSRFREHAFECPAMPGPPLAGESFDDYKKRCDAFSAKWREKNLTHHEQRGTLEA